MWLLLVTVSRKWPCVYYYSDFTTLLYTVLLMILLWWAIRCMIWHVSNAEYSNPTKYNYSRNFIAYYLSTASKAVMSKVSPCLPLHHLKMVSYQSVLPPLSPSPVLPVELAPWRGETTERSMHSSLWIMTTKRQEWFTKVHTLSTLQLLITE